MDYLTLTCVCNKHLYGTEFSIKQHINSCIVNGKITIEQKEHCLKRLDEVINEANIQIEIKLKEMKMKRQEEEIQRQIRVKAEEKRQQEENARRNKEFTLTVGNFEDLMDIFENIKDLKNIFENIRNDIEYIKDIKPHCSRCCQKEYGNNNTSY